MCWDTVIKLLRKRWWELLLLCLLLAVPTRAIRSHYLAALATAVIIGTAGGAVERFVRRSK